MRSASRTSPALSAARWRPGDDRAPQVCRYERLRRDEGLEGLAIHRPSGRPHATGGGLRATSATARRGPGSGEVMEVGGKATALRPWRRRSRRGAASVAAHAVSRYPPAIGESGLGASEKSGVKTRTGAAAARARGERSDRRAAVAGGGSSRSISERAQSSSVTSGDSDRRVVDGRRARTEQLGKDEECRRPPSTGWGSESARGPVKARHVQSLSTRRPRGAAALSEGGPSRRARSRLLA